MTFAWYGHLKFHHAPLTVAILASWGIAFVEYCFQVPANRAGHVNFGGPFSASELKIIQEVISITVFIVFALLWLKETPRWNHIVAFVLIFAAVALAVWPAPKS